MMDEIIKWGKHSGRFDAVDFGMTILRVVVGNTFRIVLWGK